MKLVNNVIVIKCHEGTVYIKIKEIECVRITRKGAKIELKNTIVNVALSKEEKKELEKIIVRYI